MKYNFEDLILYKNILLQKKTIQIRIVSDSMSPLIKSDEVLEIKPLNSTLKRFDLVVFWHDDKLTCHFLWQIHIDHYYLFKSLKHPRSCDPPIEKKFLLGQVHSRRLNTIQKIKIFFLNII